MSAGPGVIEIPTCKGCDHLDMLEWSPAVPAFFIPMIYNTGRCRAKGMALIDREWVPLTPVPSWCPFTDDEVTT